MAEGFEPYHVPQQSRRDKLRHVAQTHFGAGCVDSGLIPLYDPSLLSSDLLTCAPPVGVLKEGGVNGNLMGFVSSTSQHHPFLDPQSSLPINPYFYQNFQNLRSNYDHQSYNGHGDTTSTSTGQGLSLSLSSHHTHHSNLPLELNYMVPAGIIGGAGSGSASNEVSRSSVPLGPFTGYSSILKGSKFLKPAQQLMEELCDAGRAIYAEKIAPDSALMEPSMDSSGDLLSCLDGSENRRKKSRLLSMLDELSYGHRQANVGQTNWSIKEPASSNSLVSENPSTSTQRFHDNPPSKHGRNDFAPPPVESEEALNLSYHNLSGHQHMGVSVGMAVGSGVSLTLGLHQNNGIGLSDSYPINAAQRFGLEGSNEGYVMGNFVQN
ncbi:BEL1-like homeodomain protein 9 [Tripterygium wilfordii]|uniref:BEL1-like homeodomain protein 9 n=1 Tax=Tripterygium wilfordii TaxID=458696 RepID=A0A7J7CSV6_TRIWF|nr:BEL1-like homeodomain protein 9 [Tripterygium wilfordii]